MAWKELYHQQELQTFEGNSTSYEHGSFRGQSGTSSSILANYEKLTIEAIARARNGKSTYHDKTRRLYAFAYIIQEGVKPVIDIMDTYDITRDDWDSVMELVELTQPDLHTKIPTNVKSAFTRKYTFPLDYPLTFSSYNQHHHAMKVASGKKVKGKGASNDDDSSEPLYDEEGRELESSASTEDQEEEEGDDDDVKEDKMIKVKTPSAKKGAKTTEKKTTAKKSNAKKK
jgi:hypothetical protein